MPGIERICVFCGSRLGARPEYEDMAARLADEIVRRGLTLVYGGGNVGLMGIIADRVLANGGSVIGVIPDALVAKEVAHKGVTELHIVSTMHQRKALMADLADAFIALPGGYGTLDEFCEIITWAQLGIHRKPCALLNVQGYFDPLMEMFDQAVREGFLGSLHRDLVLSAGDPAALLEELAGVDVPYLPKWAKPGER